MAGARHNQNDRPEQAHSAVDEMTAKVIFMELANAKGPLSALDLSERTLLSEVTVEAVLEDLADAGLCTVLPADGRRPQRFAAKAEAQT